MFLLCLVIGLSLPVWAFLVAVLALLIILFAPPFLRTLVRNKARLAVQVYRRTGWSWPLHFATVSGGSEPTLSTYGSFQREIGYAGQLVDQNPFLSQSLQNDQAVAIQFGNAVARSAADNTCKAPAADGDVLIGIALRHAIMPTQGRGDGGTNLVQYAQYAEVPVLRDGIVYAIAFENVVRGDGVISVTAQNGALSGTTAGAAGTGRVAMPGGKWETTTAAGNVGIIRLNN